MGSRLHALPDGPALHGAGQRWLRTTGLAAGATLIAVASAFGIAAAATDQPASLALLATLSTAGLMFIAGVGFGVIRFGAKEPADTLAETAAAGLPAAVVLTAPDATILYENGRLASHLPGCGPNIIDTLGYVAATDPAASEAIFRLARAAGRGTDAAETVAIQQGDGAGHIRTTALHIGVRPVAGGNLGLAPRATQPLCLWTIEPATAASSQADCGIAESSDFKTLLQSLPVPAVAIAADDAVSFANPAATAALFGTGTAGVSGRRIKLSDHLSPESLTALREALSTASTSGQRLDLTLVKGGHSARDVQATIYRSPARPAAGAILILGDLAARTVPKSGEDLARLSGQLLNTAPFGMVTVAANGRVVSWNPSFERLSGQDHSLTGVPVADVLCQYCDDTQRRAFEKSLADAVSGIEGLAPADLPGRRKDMALRVYFASMGAAKGAEAATLYVLDISEQKDLEQRFAQSQKMEAVGQLAGGIAHDFNNVLTAIIGFSDLLLQMHRPTDAAYKDIMNIKSSANRAASLVSNLLGFSRQQTQKNSVLHLGEAISDLTPMLRTSIGEKIELKTETERDLWLVNADPAQVANVILNLANNARDAMPGGGRLTIATHNAGERDIARLDLPGLVPGEYVVIDVTDTGSGMSADVMAKVFEPFFTTKPVGKGTGLGLASAYGIVKQSGGYIWPESEVGRGTTFRIFLPRYIPIDDDSASAGSTAIAQLAAPAPAASVADLTGAGRVLLVEDEDIVRSFAVRALKRQGYQVLEASDGVEALDILDSLDGDVDLVISDVVMPEMDGPALLKELRKRNPSLKIIFVSGYPNDAFRQSLGEEQFAFLPKPFSLPQLAAKVKEQLALP